MPNVQTPPSTPLYKQVINSKPVGFALEKPELAGVGVLGSGVIVAEAARHSDKVLTVLKKGVVPLAATGVALTGASMVKDAIQNDWPQAGVDLDKTAHFILKTTAGTAMTLGGIEVAGQMALNVSPLAKTAKAVSKVAPPAVLGFGGLAAGTATVTVMGARNMRENGVNLGNTLAVGLGATTTTGMALASLTGFEKLAPAVDKVAPKPLSVVGGAALGLGAYALGKHTVKAFEAGRSGEAVLTAVGATAAGAGALHVLGNATGLPVLNNLAQKIFLKNPVLAGSVVAVTLTGAGYLAYSQAQAKAPEKAAE